MAARGLGGTPIAGTGASRVSVSQMGSAQTAMVKFDSNGRFLFAIMKPCGNPVTATPPKPQPKPKAECKNLIQEKISDTRRRYQAIASTKNGATVKSYTFVATKDGQRIDRETKQSAGYTLNTSGPGDYTVKVTVHTSEGPQSGAQCTKSFSIAKPPTPTPDQPGVAIEKYVGTDQKYQRVGVNVEYTYQIRVMNTGDVALKNVNVTDTPDQGITLLSVSPVVGTISDNTWAYTIPTLGVGQTLTYTLTAKVPVYLAGKLVNTVCVDAPEVPGNPDDCDNAEVDVPPVPGKIEVCELATYKLITINEADFDSSKHSKDLNDCKAPEVLPETGPIETAMQIVGAMSLVGAGAYYAASRRLV
jgi:fimbrial isopeptide formation D2 family protein